MYLSNWVRGVFFFVSVKTGSRCVGCVVGFELYSWDFPRVRKVGSYTNWSDEAEW